MLYDCQHYSKSQQRAVMNEPIPRLFTLKQFCEAHPAFAMGGMRQSILHSHLNGLDESGAILRNGRRILVDESKWFEWLLAVQD